MSGYRSLHRETLGKYPIWSLAASATLKKKSSATNASNDWRIFAACGDGIVRGYLVGEKSLEEKGDTLDASACTLTVTTLFLGKEQTVPPESEEEPMVLGCTQVEVARNYVGDDDSAGDLLVASMDLAGRVRIWQISEDADGESSSSSSNEKTTLKALQEFDVEQATGTCMRIVAPKIAGVGDVCVAVARLDGTVACIATGLVTPKATKDPKPAGSILETWGKPGSIAMSLAWHPSKKFLAIGRQDGLVEYLEDKPHRLIMHHTPVRALSFTPDSYLLVTGSDEGMIAIWDTSRPNPALVHHVMDAHNGSWILSLAVMLDSRRFVTGSVDSTLNVWNVGQIDRAMHTFSSDGAVWSSSVLQDPPRLVAGNNKGGLQIYSLEP
ncbi:unnamed protein product [Cylindrotheca closterium]|uniref:WD40 repeat-like protein n=1 Tax=Cylindrotheca closterium TaxID=2856 RepID=A0AAD2GC76_9STRA|nr:unnamed protein product [Cylindrotheca closterium]